MYVKTAKKVIKAFCKVDVENKNIQFCGRKLKLGLFSARNCEIYWIKD